MNTNSSHQRTRKVNTKGKYLHTQMRCRLLSAFNKHQPLLLVIAKEQAYLYGITEEYFNGKPAGWFADLVNAGAYGMCRGALAWQQKEIEGLKTTIFDGELKQAARVRVKQMARKIYRYRKEFELTNEI